MGSGVLVLQQSTMDEILSSEDTRKLLRNKCCFFLGDSVMRGVYKDFLWLLNHNSLIPQEVLGAKGETCCPNIEEVPHLGEEIKNTFPHTNRDTLGEEFNGLHSGRNYEETRSYF